MKPYALSAIRTTFHGPTNTRGARIIARRADYKGGDLRVTVEWDYGLDSLENHTNAATRFAVAMGWSGRYVAGATSEGYVFVRIPKAHADACGESMDTDPAFVIA